MQGLNSEPLEGSYSANPSLPSLPYPTPYQIKPYYVSGTKDFLRRYIEIYKHLLSKCFKNVVLGGQEMVQYKYFFCHQTCLLKIYQVRRFLAVLWGHIIFNVKWVEVHKMSESFWAKLYCKSVIFFVSFCWFWDFLLENLKLKKI